MAKHKKNSFFFSKKFIGSVVVVLILLGLIGAFQLNSKAQEAVAGEAIKLGTATIKSRPPISCGTVIDDNWPSMIVLKESDPVISREGCVGGIIITKSFVTVDGNFIPVGREIALRSSLDLPFITIKGSGVTLKNFYFRDYSASSLNYTLPFEEDFTPIVKVEGRKAHINSNDFLGITTSDLYIDEVIHDAIIDNNLFYFSEVYAPSGNIIYGNDFSPRSTSRGIYWPGASKPTLCSPNKKTGKGNFFALPKGNTPVGPCDLSQCHFTTRLEGPGGTIYFNSKPACNG